MENSQDDCNLSERLVEAIIKRNDPSESTVDIEELIDLGVDVNRMHDGKLPLHCTIFIKDSKCLLLLLQNGARINEINLDRETALHCVAKRYGWGFSLDFANTLIQHGAHINAVDNRNQTPLHAAISVNNTKCAQLFLENGADINPCDKDNVTPLYMAVWSNHTECVKLMLNYGANINVGCDAKIRPPLSYAVINNNIECIKLLLQHGADINVVEHSWGFTPLYYAVHYNRIECVHLLIKHGADIEVKDKDGNTALNWVANGYKCKNVEMAKVLLDYNASVTNKNGLKKTPLTIAAEKASKLDKDNKARLHYEACVELLIRASGQFDIRNKKGELLPDIARDKKLSEMLLPLCIHPRSLTELCRYRIRSNFQHQYLPNVIPLLNLPKKLQEFLLLQ